MKDIPGYEGLYAITTEGRVWAYPNHCHDGLWLKQSLRKGYPFVDLSKRGTTTLLSIHRLVALTYIPNTRQCSQINHKNGIKADNRVDNLEWCTPSENSQHSWDSGFSRVSDAKRKASAKNALIAHAAYMAKRRAA